MPDRALEVPQFVSLWVEAPPVPALPEPVVEAVRLPPPHIFVPSEILAPRDITTETPAASEQLALSALDWHREATAGCVVGLGFFGCALGDPPEIDTKGLTAALMNGPEASVPDATLCE
ncbi:MAG: hypothetical protein ABW136_02195 [Steroidobacteraceae bacterium]